MTAAWYVRYGPNGGGTVVFTKRYSEVNDSSAIGGSGAPHFEVTSGADTVEKGIPQDITESLAFASSVKKATTFSYSVKVKNLGASANTFFIAFRAKLKGTGLADGSVISVNSPGASVAPGGWQTVSGTFAVNWSNSADYTSGLCWARVHLAQSGGQAFQFDDFFLNEISHDETTNLAPEPDAVALSGSGGNNVRLHAGRSKDRDGIIISYDWDFGDGAGWQNNLGPDVNHTYASAGAWSARLRVTDDEGHQAEKALAVVAPFLPRPAGFDGYARTIGSLQSQSAGGNMSTRALEWAAVRTYPQTSQGVSEDGRIPASELAGNDTDDLNGRLLFPDGQPRYRLMVCDGGTTRSMFNNFTSRRAVNNALEFFRNGGGWVGTCAGTDILTQGFTKPLASFKGGGGHAEHEKILGYVPVPVNYWGVGSRSRGGIKAYLNDGTGSETGARKLSPSHFLMDCPSWAGGTVATDVNGKLFAQGLFRESSFIYKTTPGTGSTHPAGNHPDIEYAMYFDPATETNPAYYDTGGGTNPIPMDNAWAAFSYTDPTNPLAGRAAGAFFHTEGATTGGTATSGSPRLLQPGASWYPYLFREMDYVDQRTQAVPLLPKACLTNGSSLVVNSPTTMVGDKQYHYYALQVPAGALNLTVTLTGLTSNCDLYFKKSGWPLTGSSDYSSAATGSTTSETIQIFQPEAGVYLVGVYGNHSVTNGAPYTLSANWENAEVLFEDAFSYNTASDGKVSAVNAAWTDAVANKYLLRGSAPGPSAPRNTLYTSGTASGSGVDVQYVSPLAPLSAPRTYYVGFNLWVNDAPGIAQDLFRFHADNAGSLVTRARLAVSDGGGSALTFAIGAGTETKVSTSGTFAKNTLYRVVVAYSGNNSTPPKVWIGGPGALVYGNPQATATGVSSSAATGFGFYFAAGLDQWLDNVIFTNDWNQAAANSSAALPAEPASLSAVLAGSSAVLSWNAVPGAHSYQVARSVISGGPYTALASEIFTTTWTDTGLAPGTYFYVVSAVNANGGSGPTSPEASVSYSASLPAAPAGLTATAGNGQVTLNWSPVAGATGYNIMVGLVAGQHPQLLATGVAGPSYLDTSLSNGTTYYYVVTASGAGGTGPESNEAFATPGPAPQLLSAVSRKTHGGAGQIDLGLAVSGATGVEPRSGGASGVHTLILTFDKTLVGGGSTVSVGVGQAGTPVFSGSNITIPLSGVGNSQKLSLALTNISASNGAKFDGSFSFRLLAGDASRDGTVNVADTAQVKAASGSQITSATAAKDINADGSINVADTAAVKAASGSTVSD